MELSEIEKEKIEIKKYIDEIENEEFVKRLKQIIKSYNKYKKRNV